MRSIKFKTKVLSFILAFVMIVCSVPAYAQETQIEKKISTQNQVITQETGLELIPKDELTIQNEVVSRREANVKHFDLGNGIYQAISYGSAVHRKNSDGEWQDIDNRLYLDTNKSTRYSTADGRTTVASSAGTTENLISLSENGYVISMSPITEAHQKSTPEKVKIQNHEPLKKIEKSSFKISDVTSISNKTSVRYNDVFSSTDIEYILESNDIKENIIVKSPQKSYTYSFSLSVTNLIPQLNSSGEIIFYDSNTKEEKYHIPAPYMYDSTGNLSYNVYYELSSAKDSYVINIVADDEWINNKERVFPVTIDPTIESVGLYDTYITSEYPNTCYDEAQGLRVSTSCITFIKNANMPTIPSGCEFHSAYLNVYYYYNDDIIDESIAVGAYQITGTWDEPSLNWNTALPNMSTLISPAKLSTGYCPVARMAYEDSPKTTSFDITAAAVSWYNGTASNQGIALKYEQGTTDFVMIKSYESLTNHKSYFVVTYTAPTLSGVYKIRNVQTGLYLDVKDGGCTDGTEMQQWSGTSTDNNRNQLFKISFVATKGSTQQLNYYTIRSMTNSELGLGTPLSGTNRNATMDEISTSDNWDNLLYNNLWAISKNGNTYTIKNGSPTVNSYLTAASSGTNGDSVYTAESGTSTSAQWILEPYTSEDIDDIVMISSSWGLLVGRECYYDAHMVSSNIGINGPITYSVTNMDDTTTDKATINQSTGLLYALKPGQIKLKVTYSGAPYIWYWVITIYDNVEGVFYIKNVSSDKYLTPNTGALIDISDHVEQWSYSYNREQAWEFIYVDDGNYRIKNVFDDIYLTSPSSTSSEKKITAEEIITDTGADRQLWKFISDSSGNYQIEAENGNTNIIASAAESASNGGNVVQVPKSEDSTTYWNLIPWESMHTDVFMNWGLAIPNFTLLLANDTARNSTWKPIIEASATAWNNCGAGVNIEVVSSGTSNIEIYVMDVDDTYFGITYPDSVGSGGNLIQSHIVINTTQSTTKTGQSTTVHEIGHLLWLVDSPETTDKTIMSYGRDRKKMKEPQIFDIYNVYYRYN